MICRGMVAYKVLPGNDIFCRYTCTGIQCIMLPSPPYPVLISSDFFWRHGWTCALAVCPGPILWYVLPIALTVLQKISNFISERCVPGTAFLPTYLPMTCINKVLRGNHMICRGMVAYNVLPGSDIICRYTCTGIQCIMLPSSPVGTCSNIASVYAKKILLLVPSRSCHPVPCPLGNSQTFNHIYLMAEAINTQMQSVGRHTKET